MFSIPCKTLAIAGCTLAIALFATPLFAADAPNAASIRKQAQAVFKPIAITTSPDPAARVALGKVLYFEPRLSRSGTASCNSCHNLASAGVDNLPVSLGHHWTPGTRNSPTVLNSSLHSKQFWDGRAVTL